LIDFSLGLQPAWNIQSSIHQSKTGASVRALMCAGGSATAAIRSGNPATLSGCP
jgi:hypothetical protein